MELKNEGPSRCIAFVASSRHGKTNKYGKVNSSACYRNSNVNICPVGAIALYLFDRFHIQGEELDFTRNSTWFHVKLAKCRQGSRTKEISYGAHKIFVENALRDVGIVSDSKTHMGRNSGAKHAEINGASQSQIERLGNWNKQSIDGAYLTNLPRKAMRALAGFFCVGWCFLYWQRVVRSTRRSQLSSISIC